MSEEAQKPTTAERNEAIYQRITGGKPPRDAKQRLDWIKQAERAMRDEDYDHE